MLKESLTPPSGWPHACSIPSPDCSFWRTAHDTHVPPHCRPALRSFSRAVFLPHPNSPEHNLLFSVCVLHIPFLPAPRTVLKTPVHLLQSQPDEFPPQSIYRFPSVTPFPTLHERRLPCPLRLHPSLTYPFTNPAVEWAKYNHFRKILEFYCSIAACSHPSVIHNPSFIGLREHIKKAPCRFRSLMLLAHERHATILI